MNFPSNILRSSFVISLFFLFNLNLIAQEPLKTKQEDKYKVNVTANKSVDIEFSSDKNIRNLLVIIFDNAGNTVFMDNQYNFKGDYKRSVDLREQAKGTYSIKISNDTEAPVNKMFNVN